MAEVKPTHLTKEGLKHYQEKLDYLKVRKQQKSSKESKSRGVLVICQRTLNMMMRRESNKKTKQRSTALRKFSKITF